jgi:hypothetical protein
MAVICTVKIDLQVTDSVGESIGTVIAKAYTGSTVRQFDKETSSAQSNCGMEN